MAENNSTVLAHGWKVVRYVPERYGDAVSGAAARVLRSQQGNQTWQIGQWAEAVESVEPCRSGYHDSPTLYDALGYVDGPVVAQTENEGPHIGHASGYRSGYKIDKHAHRQQRLVRAWLLEGPVLDEIQALLVEKFVPFWGLTPPIVDADGVSFCDACASLYNLAKALLDHADEVSPAIIADFYDGFPTECERGDDEDARGLDDLNCRLIALKNAKCGTSDSYSGSNNNPGWRAGLSLATLRNIIASMAYEENNRRDRTNERNEYDDDEHEELIDMEALARAFDELVLPFLNATTQIGEAVDAVPAS